ncbi:VOC family protein [Polaribacter sp.]|nr:VOC family protein [Polaribacter sp.]
MNAQTAIKVEKVTLTVNDLDVTVPFYQNLFGFKKIGEYSLSGKKLKNLTGINNDKLSVKVIQLQLGDELIELQEFENEGIVNQIPLDSKSNDLWFQHMAIVVNNMEEAYKKLQNYGVVHVSTAPQTLPDYIPEAAGIKAFYFQDPDKHIVEIIYFPKGKGDSKWQKKTDNLFLGIDHSAIAISNTKASTFFYEDLVGLKLKGHSENYGSEQEHLNQVFGARLWISGLRAKEGIGIEFLEYIAPPGGRAYPKISKPTDIWHWHTTIMVSNIDQTYAKMKQSASNFISKEIVSIKNKKQFMVRDADGHALLIIQK